MRCYCHRSGRGRGKTALSLVGVKNFEARIHLSAQIILHIGKILKLHVDGKPHRAIHSFPAGHLYCSDGAIGRWRNI